MVSRVEEETKKESTSETFLKRKLESKISGRRSPKEEEIGMIEVATSPAGQIEKLSDLDDQMELARTNSGKNRKLDDEEQALKGSRSPQLASSQSEKCGVSASDGNVSRAQPFPPDT